MAILNHKWEDYVVDDMCLANYKELVDLILKTDSMNEQQKQYWFDIMPSMPDFQIDNLFWILDNERKEIEKIELDYQSKVKDLNKKHLIEWQSYKNDEDRKKIKEEEKKDSETTNPDDVLSMLDDL